MAGIEDAEGDAEYAISSSMIIINGPGLPRRALHAELLSHLRLRVLLI